MLSDSRIDLRSAGMSGVEMSVLCCFKNYPEVGYHKSLPVDSGRMTQVRIIYCVELGGYSNYKVSRPDPGTSHTPTEISIIEVTT